jgi:hypothetical protein
MKRFSWSLGALSHISMKEKMKCGTMLFFLAAHGGEEVLK